MASTISASELEAIKRRAFVGGLVVRDDAVEWEKTKKARAKELSKTRTKAWPNTLEAQRAAKARMRQERLDREEAAR